MNYPVFHGVSLVIYCSETSVALCCTTVNFDVLCTYVYLSRLKQLIRRQIES